MRADLVQIGQYHTNGGPVDELMGPTISIHI